MAAKAEKIQSDAIRSQAGDAIITLAADGTIESVNPAAERIFDYAADQLTGRFVGGLLAEGEDLVARLMAWEESSGPTIETLALRRDGSTITVEISLSKVFLGEWQQFVVIMRDISRRKEMDNALRESEERFRSLSESSPVGVFFADIQGNCIYTNDRWHQITGLPASPTSGLCWIDAVHDKTGRSLPSIGKSFWREGRNFAASFALWEEKAGFVGW
jgi:PAS domain S-box-containing protein